MQKDKECFGSKLEPNGQITINIVLYGGTVLYGRTPSFQTDRTCTVLYGVLRYRNYGQESWNTAYLDKPDIDTHTYTYTHAHVHTHARTRTYTHMHARVAQSVGSTNFSALLAARLLCFLWKGLRVWTTKVGNINFAKFRICLFTQYLLPSPAHLMVQDTWYSCNHAWT